MTRHHSCRVSPFGHPRITARLTAPRGISQPPTSFIGSQCQGIHHAPLNTYKHKTNSKKKLHIREQQPHPQPPSEKRNLAAPRLSLARCSQPLSTNQTPHPTTKSGATTRLPIRRPRTTGLLPQSPIVCSVKFPPARIPATGTFVVHQNHNPLQV